MSGNGSVVVPPDSTGKAVDCTSLSVGGVVAMRQRIIIADPTSSAGFATVTNSRLNVNAGTIDKISATVNVQGTVSIADGAAVNISTMPAVSLAAGTNQIGYLQKISAAVALASLNGLGKIDGISAAVSLASLNGLGKIDGISAAVVLAAGAAHIGEVNISLMPAVVLAAGAAHVGEVNISLMPAVNISVMPAVVLAAGAAKIGRIAAISATVNVAGTFTISTIDKISATTIVAGVVTLGAAANNIGTINNISATVIVAGSLSIGGFTGGTSVTAASSFTLIGGTDGSLGRVALMDAAGHQIISGTVALTTLNGLGKIDGISAAVSIASLNGLGKIDGISANVNVVIAAGANNIGTVNNISAAVVLAAGVANIGLINNISATVVTTGVITNTVAVSGQVSVTGSVAISTIPNVNISAMPSVVLAAGAANIGTIQAISAPVTIANGAAVNISTMPSVVIAAGTNNIGTIQAISATVTAAIMKVGTSGSAALANNALTVGWCDKFGRQMVGVHPSIVAGATQGPQSFLLTASGTVVLVASAGAQSIYVTGLMVTNGSGTLLQMKIFEGAHTASAEVVAWCAASGGGYQAKFDPPWQLSAGTALGACQVPGALTAHVMVQFYLGPA